MTDCESVINYNSTAVGPYLSLTFILRSTILGMVSLFNSHEKSVLRKLHQERERERERIITEIIHRGFISKSLQTFL